MADMSGVLRMTRNLIKYSTVIFDDLAIKVRTVWQVTTPTYTR